MLAFEKSEYQSRIKNVKEKMSSAGIEVFIVTDPANMCYLSGYDAWSFYTPQALIIMEDLDQPVWIGRFQDVKCAVETTWLDSENIVVYPDRYLWEPTVDHVMDFVADFLKEKGAANKSIWVEKDAYYFTAFWLERLVKGLPNAKFNDGTKVINWIRTVKSDKEIEYMKKAARIVEKGMQKAIDVISVGVRECDAAGEIYRALLMGTEDFGGDYPSIVPLMPAGRRSSAPHLTWTDDKYHQDQLVYLEIAGCYKRYHSPLSRTIYLGNPSEKMKETAEVIMEGLSAAMAAVKPGNHCEDVEKAWKEVITRHGLKKESRMGYSIGLSYPPVWADDTAYMRPGDKTVLQPNMTFHLMPGMWFEDFGIAITEAIRVTETGCETLANFPRKLFVK